MIDRGQVFSARAMFVSLGTRADGTTLAPGAFFLFGGSAYAGSHPADKSFTAGLASAAGGVALKDATGAIVDSVGWGDAVVGAVAIVLAAMYMLRLISAVLHESPGPAVSPLALDLRPAELSAVVPLVACLLALSVWPAAITERSFTNNRATTDVSSQFQGPR